MKLKHHFAEVEEAIELFKVEKLSQFKSKLNKLSKNLPEKYPLVWGRNKDETANQNKIKGDGFELFCELFVYHFGIHPQIGLANYTPVDPLIDEGIDALAININEEQTAIQCKFINDTTYQFAANKSNLPNFLVEATLKKIAWEDTDKIKRVFLITTAKGLHYHTQEKWQNKVKVISGNDIKLLVDNNRLFWKSCERILKNG